MRTDCVTQAALMASRGATHHCGTARWMLGIFSLHPQQCVSVVWGMGIRRVKKLRQVIMSLISPCDLIKM